MFPFLAAFLLQVPEKPYIPCSIDIKGNISQAKVEKPNVRRTEEYLGKLKGFMVETHYGKNAVFFTFVSDPKQKSTLTFKSCTYGTTEDNNVSVFSAKRFVELRSLTFSSKFRNWPLTPSGGEVSLVGEEALKTVCPGDGEAVAGGSFSGYQGRLFFDLPDDDEQKQAPSLKMELGGLWALQAAVIPFSTRGTITYNHVKNGTKYSGNIEIMFNFDPAHRVSTF